MSPDDELQKTLNEAAEDSQMGFLGILAVNFGLAAGSSSFTRLLRSLQIIVVMPLLEAHIPPNAAMIFKYLTEIAAFDYYDIEEETDNLLELEQTEPVNNKLEAMGLSTR